MRVSRLAVLLLFGLMPCIVFGGAIQVNSACPLGNCVTPDTLASGNSTSGNVDFVLLLANNDRYRIATGSSATDTGGTGFSSSISGLTVVYLGNSVSGAVPSGADVITIDYLQNFFSTITSGAFSESISATFGGPIGAGSNVQAQQFVGGNPLPVLGPFPAPGSFSGSSSGNPVSGLGNPLLFDFRVTINVAAGSGVGAGVNTPEPATLTLDGPFQVSYAANPSAGESLISMINTGANGDPLLGPGFGGAAGNTCVNVYAFDPAEELIACCSCLLTPNQVANLGVNANLTIKTQTGVVPTSVTIKLVNTLAGPGGTTTSCTNSASMAGGANFPVVSGLVAYGTTPQAVGTTYNVVEHPFIPATLSGDELSSIAGRCAILGNASGYGICTQCRLGALGAGKR
jgi:hypothetical protein